MNADPPLTPPAPTNNGQGEARTSETAEETVNNEEEDVPVPNPPGPEPHPQDEIGATIDNIFLIKLQIRKPSTRTPQMKTTSTHAHPTWTFRLSTNPCQQLFAYVIPRSLHVGEPHPIHPLYR